MYSKINKNKCTTTHSAKFYQVGYDVTLYIKAIPEVSRCTHVHLGLTRTTTLAFWNYCTKKYSFGNQSSHYVLIWNDVRCILIPPFQNKSYIWTKIALRNKSYVWWHFSQTSPNKLECFQKQCKCCFLWTTKSNNSLHLFNNWYLDSTTSTHINTVLCALVPSAQNDGLPMKLAPKVFNFTMNTPSSP